MTRNAAFIILYIMLATAMPSVLAGIHAAIDLESATIVPIERIQEDSWQESD